MNFPKGLSFSHFLPCNYDIGFVGPKFASFDLSEMSFVAILSLIFYPLTAFSLRLPHQLLNVLIIFISYSFLAPVFDSNHILLDFVRSVLNFYFFYRIGQIDTACLHYQHGVHAFLSIFFTIILSAFVYLMCQAFLSYLSPLCPFVTFLISTQFQDGILNLNFDLLNLSFYLNNIDFQFKYFFSLKIYLFFPFIIFLSFIQFFL